MDIFGVSLPFLLYSLSIAATLLIGLLYALSPRIMPYHEQALETPWAEVDPKYQYMLKALLNGGGYSGIATGLFMLVLLLIPFRAGEAWAGYAIGGIGLVGLLPLTAIVYGVRKNTAGNPPLALMIIISAVHIAGLITFAAL